MKASTGNVHVVFFCPQDMRAKGEQLIKDVQRRALRMEGTITGEHGIGLSLRDMLPEEVGSAGVDMMRNVCILSLPGRCVKANLPRPCEPQNSGEKGRNLFINSCCRP